MVTYKYNILFTPTIRHERKRMMKKGKKMKMTVAKKLLFGFFIVFLLFGIVAGLSNYELEHVNKQYEEIIDNRVPVALTVKDLKIDLYNQANGINGYLLTGDSSYLEDFESARKRLIHYIDVLKESAHHQESQQLVEEIDALHTQFYEIAEEQITLKIQQNEAAYMELAETSAKEAGEEFITTADSLVKVEENLLSEQTEETAAAVSTIQMIVLFSSIGAIILGVIVAYFIGASISKPIKLAAKTIDLVAEGDLSQGKIKVKNRDEIGSFITSLNKMVHELRLLVGQVRDTSSQVASSSEEMAASSEQSTLASEQVAHISQSNVAETELQLNQFQEISLSVGEMSSGIKEISQSSEKMLSATEKATELTDKGTDAVKNVVQQMKDINTSVGNATQYITALKTRSEEISNFVGMITSIADQTNLLALNAAIEAARAGEHGKGFAVVADEVRKLAEESKKSADQIQQMVDLIQGETEQAVIAMEEGNAQVHEGLTDTENANAAFLEIFTSIGDVIERVAEVNISIETLSEISDKINEQIITIKDISERNVSSAQETSAATEEQLATMEEVATSAESLAKLSEDLQTVVSRFKL